MSLIVARVILLNGGALLFRPFISFAWWFELYLRMRMVFKINHRVIRGGVLEAKVALKAVLILDRVDRRGLGARCCCIPLLGKHWRLIHVSLCLRTIVLIDKEGRRWNVQFLSSIRQVNCILLKIVELHLSTWTLILQLEPNRLIAQRWVRARTSITYATMSGLLPWSFHFVLQEL